MPFVDTLAPAVPFQLTEEQLAVQAAAREFAQRELLPGVLERDEHQRFPAEQVKRLGELGFLGLLVPPTYGGTGLDTISYVLALAEIAQVDAACAVIMSITNSLVCYGLYRYGTEEQKQRYLPGLCAGDSLGAFALSEPEAGSDATSQRTTAEDRGDYYLLNGTKNWITNGTTASVYLVIAQTHPELKHRGINAFLVERDAPGFMRGPKENKMGIRASDTCSLHFTDVHVPKANRIGPDGAGFTLAMQLLAGGRIGIAAQALGIASGALALSLAYAKQRRAFGVPIAQHQAIQFKLADMATSVEAARLLCLQAAADKDQGRNYARSGAMAKLFASQTAMDAAIEAVQIHGGYGYVKEYHVERLLRDAKVTQIYEGTSEIQRIIIARQLLKEA